MFLTVHSTIGIAIATKAASPWLAFIFSFFAHYILDAIPHGDESIFKNHTAKQKYQNIIKFLIIDLVIMAIYIFFIMTKVPLNPVIIFAAVLGSILPDILWGLYDVTHLKILKPFMSIHNLFHNPLKIELPLKVGLILQIAIIIVITLLLI